MHPLDVLRKSAYDVCAILAVCRTGKSQTWISVDKAKKLNSRSRTYLPTRVPAVFSEVSLKPGSTKLIAIAIGLSQARTLRFNENMSCVKVKKIAVLRFLQ